MDVGDRNARRCEFDEFRVIVEMSCKVSDTARAQLGVYLAHVARIDLPERDRHIVNELAVARLARAQIEVGSIFVGCAVDGADQRVRSIVAPAPYGKYRKSVE